MALRSYDVTKHDGPENWRFFEKNRRKFKMWLKCFEFRNFTGLFAYTEGK